jgi:hypothetical protein
VRRFFQIRHNDTPVDSQLYSSLEGASRALVKRNDPEAQVVELDTPGGAVVRKFTFDDCQAILRSSSSE